MRKMPPKHLQMAQKLGSFLCCPGDAHNALLRPTYLYCHPLHSTFDHIICVIHGMSRGNVKSCEKSCEKRICCKCDFLVRLIVV